MYVKLKKKQVTQGCPTKWRLGIQNAQHQGQPTQSGEKSQMAFLTGLNVPNGMSKMVKFSPAQISTTTAFVLR